MPSALATWVGAAGGVLRPNWLIWMLVPIVAGALGILLSRQRRQLGWVFIALFLGLLSCSMALVLSVQRAESPLALAATEQAVATIDLRVATEAQPTQRGAMLRAEANRFERRGVAVELRAPILLLGDADVLDTLVVGARYQVTAKLSETGRGDSTAAVLSLRGSARELSPPGPLKAAATALRSGLRSAMRFVSPDQAALVPSLVVGDTAAISEAQAERFAETGLTHLMAVSGANLTLTLSLLLIVARWVGLRGWLVRGVAALGVGGFLLVCGNEPSVLRATAMGLIGLAATGLGKGRRSIRSLCVAVGTLCWIDPWLSLSAGFALSVLACAGIVLLSPSYLRVLGEWCPRWIAEAVAVSLSAQLATQLVVTGISGEISMVGLLANVLAAPFVGPTTVLGLLATLLSPISPLLASGLGWLAGWACQPILTIAQFGAALPNAAWAFPSGILPLAMLGLVLVAVGAVLWWLLRRFWGALLALMLLLSAAHLGPIYPGWPGTWQAGFCDVGQGDATALAISPHSAMLVDAGPEAPPVLRCLQSLGIREVPVLLLTHYHADHIGGATELIERFRPELILVRQGQPPDWLQRAAAQAGSQLREASPGETLEVGQMLWRTISVGESPTAEGNGESAEENDASVVGVAQIGGLRVLLAGDAEPMGQSRALSSADRLGSSLEVDVLKLPHHGSARQDSRFFGATHAVLAVASAGEGNDYGHPSEAALELSRQHGMTIARTDSEGSIAVYKEEGRVLVNRQRNGS